jgi:hypothetical protein
MYGRGGYFAEEPKVVEQYANQLPQQAWDAFNEAIGDSSYLTVGKNKYIYNSPEAVRRSVEKGDITVDEVPEGLRPYVSNSGNIYTADLDVNHEDLLDWDVPLYEQPEKVKKALEQLGVDTQMRGQWTVEPTKTGDKYVLRNVWGESAGIYKDKAKAEALAAQRTRESNAGGAMLAYTKLGGNTAYPQLDAGKASETLRAAGIPGIRYLDQGSRAGGEGSRNLVIFDDMLIKLLERNGMPITPSGNK